MYDSTKDNPIQSNYDLLTAVLLRWLIFLTFSNFLSFWATVCKTVRHMLSVIYPSSVCNVGVLCSNGWMDQDATWYGGRPRPRPHCAVVCGFCWLCSKSAGALPLNQAERRESSDHLFARSRILAIGSPCL